MIKLTKKSLLFAIIIFCISLISLAQSTELNQTIDCVNDYIDTFQQKMRPELFRIFKKSFPNTLETTVQNYDLTPGNELTYIITGDIQAMWLRDSTNQWLPYLKLERQCPHMKSLTKGLLNQQAQFIMIDPYTNAFKKFEKSLTDRPFYLNDKTQKLIFGIPVDLCRRRQFATRSIWQRKYEIDSLASYLRLSYEYFNKYQDLNLVDMNFISALKRITTTLKQQIKDAADEKALGINYYTFYRNSQQLANGTIKPSSKTGMIKTGFRPSDDANELPYNVPGNGMLASFLTLLSSQVLSKVSCDSVFYKTVQDLRKKMEFYAQSIMTGIKNYAIVQRPASEGGNAFAYQIDGFGKFRLYDDANLPSLLSLPYMGFLNANDETYKSTRAYVLSTKNPFYFQKEPFKGQGSSHTARYYIWPLALIVEILTSSSDSQIKNCLYSLQMSGKNDLMHESFNVNNPQMITREWFAWANSFFGQMIITLSKTKPELLK